MKKARIIMRNRRGNNAEMVLKAGEKGTGKDIQVVHVWTDSPRSLDKADEIFAEVAKREGYRIV